MFNESQHSKAEKIHNMLQQLRSIEATLDYWETKTTDRRARIIRLAKEALRMVADDVYNEELSGVVRFT
jgi:hypothetical protein